MTGYSESLCCCSVSHAFIEAAHMQTLRSLSRGSLFLQELVQESFLLWPTFELPFTKVQLYTLFPQYFLDCTKSASWKISPLLPGYKVIQTRDYYRTHPWIMNTYDCPCDIEDYTCIWVNAISPSAAHIFCLQGPHLSHWDSWPVSIFKDTAFERN